MDKENLLSDKEGISPGELKAYEASKLREFRERLRQSEIYAKDKEQNYNAREKLNSQIEEELKKLEE